jgi:hypothetical protein
MIIGSFVIFLSKFNKMIPISCQNYIQILVNVIDTKIHLNSTTNSFQVSEFSVLYN